jgi:plastocyanin
LPGLSNFGGIMKKIIICLCALLAGYSVAQAQSLPPDASVEGTSDINIVGSITSVPSYAASNAVVYLSDIPTTAPTKQINTSVTNAQMNFLPYVAVITLGGKVMFTNNDPFPHNVFSPDNGGWDIGIISQHEARVKIFNSLGANTLLCNLHPNMKGYVLVVPNSYFAKADGKGKFNLKGVPIGTYNITAWAPGTKPITKSVTISSNSSIDFDLHR